MPISTHPFLALALALGLLSTSGCAGSETLDSDCENGNCDGLSQFLTVYEHSDAVRYLCGEGVEIPDGACAGLPVSNETVTTMTLLKEADGIHISAEDVRIVATSNQTLKIQEADTSFGSRAGFQLEMRPFGRDDLRWQVVAPSGAKAGVEAFWSSAEIRRWTLANLIGEVEGNAYVCSGWSCDSTGWGVDDTDVGLYDILDGTDLIEYRVTFMPIWNLGEFDEGDFTISFDVQ